METAAIVAAWIIGLAAYGMGLVLGIRLARRMNLAPLWGMDRPWQVLGFRIWACSIRVFVVLVVMLAISALAWPVLLLLEAVT
jgi:hypothetical protein